MPMAFQTQERNEGVKISEANARCIVPTTSRKTSVDHTTELSRKAALKERKGNYENG
jgi:hypothetical protein